MASTKVLRRLPAEGQIAGVCAGLGEYFDIDPTLLRVVAVVLAIVTGGGFVLVYFLMALVMPKPNDKPEITSKSLEHNAESLATEMRERSRDTRLRNFFGIGLITVGAWLLLTQVFPGIFVLGWDYVWAATLIIIGIYIATRRN